MTTTAAEYRPSINILRDANVHLNYIWTPNAQAAFDRLISFKGTGQKSFTLIGAYGTGKSAFLWAFRQQLAMNANIFKTPKHKHAFQFESIVGDYGSVREAIGRHFGLSEKSLKNSLKVVEAVTERILGLDAQNKSLILLVDEFGKFLEYAVKHDPDGELYFLQLLAETFNDPERNALFVTSLHQDFKAYSFGLTHAQRNEWEKVRGRFAELPFNEPVEELLRLAAVRMGQSKLDINPSKALGKLTLEIRKTGIYPLNNNLIDEQVVQLFPMDLLSAGVLTLGLQKFGQNQRSLFSFLESDDPLGMKSFQPSKKSPFYHLGLVFDYLEFNFQSLLHSAANPETTRWAGIKAALDKVETLMDANTEDAAKLVKAIGLLNIFGREGSQIGEKFLTTYGKMAMGIDNAEELLSDMERWKVIRFLRHSRRYVPFDGTDLDISSELDKAQGVIPDVTDPLPEVKRHFDFPYIFAKEAFFKKGTPRIFAYELSERPRHFEVGDQIDGYINLIFSSGIKPEDLQEFSGLEAKHPTLFGWYSNTGYVSALVTDILRIEHVIAENRDDRVAVRELNNIKTSKVRSLNREVLGNMHGPDAVVKWYFNGKEELFRDSQEFNQCLSRIVEATYSGTPPLENELINRTKLSSPMNTARAKYLEHLLSHWETESLGFDSQRFPPEKTIYLSLLKNTKIHQQLEDAWGLGAPSVGGWERVWNAGEDFLKSAVHIRRNLMDLVRIFKQAPIKLKQGLVEFWLPTYLFIKRDDYALFGEGKYIPSLNAEILALIQKDPSRFEIKTFDREGIRFSLFHSYRQLLQLTDEAEIGNKGLVETIRPFLVFYRQLTLYSQQTQLNLSREARDLRKAIANSTDPEHTFFVEFPQIFQFDVEQERENPEAVLKYIERLKDAIRELRTAYMALCDRLEAFLGDEILGGVDGFQKIQAELQARVKPVKLHLLPLELRVLVERIRVPLDDRDSWLASIAQTILNTRLDSITDAQEQVLKDRLSEYMREIDAFAEMSEVSEDGKKARGYMTVSEGTVRKGVSRTNSADNPKVEKLKKDIRSLLNGAKDKLVEAALIDLLEEFAPKKKH